MRLLVLSDLHILGNSDPVYFRVLRWLREEVLSGDTVVLAGDIFDLFVGNKAVFRDRYADFFDALAAAGSRGAKLHYIEGNHDFLMKDVLAAIPAVTWHSQEVSLKLFGKNILVSHGDLANHRDWGYLFLRWFFRSVFFRVFVRALPGRGVEWIGLRLSRSSRGARPLLAEGLAEGRLDRVRNIYRSYAAEYFQRGFDLVVLGHCHDLDEKRVRLGERECQYINVGFPKAHGSYLLLDLQQDPWMFRRELKA